MNQTAEVPKPHEFNKFRAAVFPIHKHELEKFLPISFLMFFILLFYTMVRDLKDVFIQKYAVLGCTELFPVLKLWFVLPFAFVAVMVFTALINKYGGYKTFYIMFSIFIAFYAIFLFFLFPNTDFIHAKSDTIIAWREKCPGFMYYIIPCITNWSYTLFYMTSEILGTMAIASLFWQFANQVTKKNEIKRFFGLYALIGNIGVIISGGMLYRMSNVSGAAFDKNVRILIGLCILFGFATMGVYYYINTVVLKDPKFYVPNETVHKKKEEKIGIMDGIKFLFTSPYLLFICVLVVAFGVTINFTEVIWKEHLRVTTTNSNEYASMMGNLSMATGILTILGTMLGTNFSRKTSWKFSAMVTPVVMLSSGSIFFLLMIFLKNSILNVFGFSTAFLALWVGLIVDALLKGIKYCLFDTTKSMAYIPLDENIKTKGQAAVEVIGGRAGKAGASFINYTLTNVIAVGSKILSHLYVIIPLFIIVVIGWIISVFNLSNRYENERKILDKANK